MERPRYLYRSASNGKRYPCWPVWYREPYPIKKHFRVLDCEDAYDSDDFYKVELRIASDPAYTEYVSPYAKQRLAYQRKARARAEAIVANIEAFKQNAINRKRLTRAKNEFDFVFEPYRQKLHQQYGWEWRWKMQAKRAALFERVWRDMRWLARRKQEEEERHEWRKVHEQRRSQDGRFAVKVDVTLNNYGHFGYGPAERTYDLQRIKEGMKWIDSFQNPYFTRIVVKIMDEQKDIRDQVDLINRIFNAAHNGTLQPLLEELNRRAGLYV